MRPFLLTLIGLSAGILTMLKSGISGTVWLISLSLATVFILYILKKKNALIKLSIICVFIILGALVSYIQETKYKADIGFYNDSLNLHNMEAVIASAPDASEFGTNYIVRIIKCCNHEFKPNKHIRLLIKEEDDPCFGYGDIIKCQFSASEPAGQRNPGGFNYRNYLKTAGVSLVGKAGTAVRIGFKPDSYIKYYSLKIRNKIVEYIRKHIPESVSGTIEGMLIGDKSNISEEVDNAFRISGIAHLLSVSGAHAAFFIMPFSFILRLIKIGKKTSSIVQIILLCIFLAVTGFAVSTVRAVIMLIISKIAFIFNKNYDSLNALCFAGTAILLMNNYNIYSVGFIMSLGAAMSIICMSGIIIKFIDSTIFLRKVPKYIKQSIAVCFAAQIGVLPVMIQISEVISLASVLANLLVIPAAQLISCTGFLTVIFESIGISFVSKILALITAFLSKSIEFTAEALSKIDFLKFSVSSMYIYEMIFYYITLVILIYAYKNKIKIAVKYKAVLIITGLIVFLVQFIPAAKLEITVIDTGQGDSILVEASNNMNIVIDTGETGEQTAEVLKYKRIRKIDALILTHAHSDHIGGANKLLETFKVESVIIPYTYNDEGFEEIISKAGSDNIKIKRLMSGSSITNGKLNLSTLSPGQDEFGENVSLNNSSLVLKLQYGEFSMLFMGDAEKVVEDNLCRKYGEYYLKSSVLKIGHHGSGSSSSEGFLSCVSPEIAVISVGKNNLYGHPSKQVTERACKSSLLYRTDLDYAVIIRTDGSKIWSRHMRN